MGFIKRLIKNYFEWRNDNPRPNWLKTIFFNFYFLPFKQAVHLPIYIYKGVHFKNLEGEVKLSVKYKWLRSGIVKIGFPNQSAATQGGSTYLNIVGKIVFHKYITIGQGCYIDVYDKKAQFYLFDRITINNNNIFSVGTKLILYEQVIIGSNCQFFTTDHHYLLKKGICYNPNLSQIVVGTRTWIGNNVLVLKNSMIASDVIIGANSLITSKCNIKDGGTYTSHSQLDQLGGIYEYSFIHNKKCQEYLWEKFDEDMSLQAISWDELPGPYSK